MSTPTPRIQLLDTNTINQIAAGEVLERPAAAVKELVENSLDAGATRIEIELAGAGRDLIRIRDNGSGMTPEELKLSLLRHATSKIRELSDLDSVMTLGFRGEAIPSIGSVSKLIISTGTEDGRRAVVRVEGGESVYEGAESGPKGTEIRVEDLFYNTPARLKFLKSDTTEVGQIVDFVMRYAIAFPTVSFTLIHNGQSVLQTTGNGEQLEAIASAWTRDMARSLVPVNGELGGLKLQGFVSPPHVTKSNRSLQYLYVNGRPMKSRTLTIALDQAFRDLTPDRRFPVVALNIEIDPSRIDVNVSPTKSEVRFQQEGLAFEAIRVCIRESLLAHGMMPSAAQIATANKAINQSLNISQSPNINHSLNEVASTQSFRGLTEHSIYAQSPINHSSVSNPAVGGLSNSHWDNPDQPRIVDTGLGKTSDTLTHTLAEASVNLNVGNNESMPYLTILDDLFIVGQAMNTFIIAETRHGLIIVDQHVAHERIIYEYLCGLKRSTLIEKQALLVPQTLHLDKRSAILLADKLEEIHSVGFEIDSFGADSFVIRSVPAALKGKDPIKYLTDLVDELVESSVNKRIIPTREQIWIMSSCKMAVKAGDPLSRAEMEKLLLDLATTENHYHCPHRRPITATLTQDDLLRLFKRI
ncbi:MAG: DNA mismatch repair endonuclease MutL [Fimbriimonadales bacterium]|nr:DNA mismatch repair endonuclease MutL [Fimbriimonadales bacterium]